ncbi:hypothetical protein [Fusibacter ferrireducens]|uniref:Uncharacterized protein n=1 Tax=Fusibacter ferrireducens TaxID=2785058 RepID=A0ABR9ZYC0_9FIRM|nr:hypothetical protein [Fusibacter ferrireducens]MBF4695450.1 hypothetical protein [Fusibacter ferrireducens]
MPKKTLFEKMGFVETSPTESEVSELGLTEESKEPELDVNKVPDLENVPDLSHLVSLPVEEAAVDIKKENFNAKELEREKAGKMNDIPKDIGDKLDLLINAYEKNKMLTIDEIYRNAHLETDVKKSIFMADVYLKAIPENLPMDLKRETVLNIMNVSNISLDELLNDAYKRIDSLNTVLEETVSTTQEIFNRNDATISELEKRIEDLKEINKSRKKFQEDQNTLIEYEIQKIINLVEFVKPKK